MAADMAAQPAVLRGLAERRAELVGSLRGPPPAGVVIVARGSSDYAAIFGRYLLEAATGRPVALAAASLQTLYGVEPHLDGWLAVGISQSGRTPEIATVLERYGSAGARTVAVTNDPESPLANAASASIALGAGERVRGDAALSAALADSARAASGAVVSSDLFYDDRPGLAAGWRELGALAVEMETAVVFRLAQLRGVRAACLLAVSDLLEAEDTRAPARHRARIEPEALEATGLRQGEAAAVLS
jgi:glucosamine--fructose-6-phosphate aminotransferase (isomerizing)